MAIFDPPKIIYVIVDAFGGIIGHPYADETLARTAAKLILVANKPLRIVPYRHDMKEEDRRL